MKVYEVNWKVPSQSAHQMISSSLYDPVRFKMFASKEKADEFYKALYDAATVIGISVDAKVIEKELE